MINQEEFFSYLQKKIPTFKKTNKKGQILFTCVNAKNHKYPSIFPDMTAITGSDKFYCLACGLKGTIYDLIRVLEEDKKYLTDGQIMEYLINNQNITTYPELDAYKKLGFSLLPIAKEGKIPLEKGWTDQTHYEKSEWLKWVAGGFNLGIRTGEVSKITVIDVDLKIAPTPELEEIYKELTASKTLIQNSPHGKHFIFQYDKTIKTTTKIAGVTIDIRNDGAQILCSPSKINNVSYNWVNLDCGIKVVPENVKVLLENKKSTPEEQTLPQKEGETPKLKNDNLAGCCNDTFTRLGGILINKLTPENVEFVLSVFNTQLLENPMPQASIKALLGSLEGYKTSENQSQELAIYECCKLLQIDITAAEIEKHTGLKKNIVNKYLSVLHKEGKLVRKRLGRYDLKRQVEWVKESQEIQLDYKYEIPYFNDIAHFYSGDMIIIGAPTGRGKTTIALNFIKQMAKQGITSYYVPLESNLGYKVAAKELGILDNYVLPKENVSNPLEIELPSNSFIVIDWINLGEDFAATPVIFKHLSDEIRQRGGILIVFSQVRDDGRWFAPDLVKQFARLSARFMYNDMSGLTSYFDIDKISNPKGHNLIARVDCEFNFETKELKKKVII